MPPDILTRDHPGECRRVLHDGLAAYKRRYPSIRYVELFNEPDKTWDVPEGHWQGLTVDDYYAWYRIGYSVVDDINRDLHPRIPLRIGGPAAASFDKDFLRGFLDGFARDPDADKRLDFISYHQYQHAADPAAVGTENRPSGDGSTSAGSTPTRPFSSPSTACSPATPGAGRPAGTCSSRPRRCRRWRTTT